MRPMMPHEPECASAAGERSSTEYVCDPLQSRARASHPAIDDPPSLERGRHRGLTAALAGAPLTLVAVAPAAAATLPRHAASGVYYEVFVRSFADTNGDGIGDLNGITARLHYFEWLAAGAAARVQAKGGEG